MFNVEMLVQTVEMRIRPFSLLNKFGLGVIFSFVKFALLMFCLSLGQILIRNTCERTEMYKKVAKVTLTNSCVAIKELSSVFRHQTTKGTHV